MQDLCKASVSNGCSSPIIDLCQFVSVSHEESFLADVFLLKGHTVTGLWRGRKERQVTSMRGAERTVPGGY